MQQGQMYRTLTEEDCKASLLDNFNRYQRVEQSWKKRNGKCVLQDTPFEENWDESKKQKVICDFKACVSGGGEVIGCFVDERLIGWSCVSKELFGSLGQYVNLDYLHVSYEYRNLGIGKALLEQAKAAAHKMGAKKLYVSGHPSKESQAFYRSVGCREAEEIDPVLFEKEPYDCHLELQL